MPEVQALLSSPWRARNVLPNTWTTHLDIGTSILNSNLAKSRLSLLIFWLPNCFEILRRARQWYCRALCQISKRFGNWNGCYGRTRFHETWAWDEFWRDILHGNNVDCFTDYSIAVFLSNNELISLHPLYDIKHGSQPMRPGSFFYSPCVAYSYFIFSKYADVIFHCRVDVFPLFLCMYHLYSFISVNWWVMIKVSLMNQLIMGFV